jgi:hypothetical protein
VTISVDWAAKIIMVPQADLTPVVSPDLYELNLDDLRLALKDLEDNEEGQVFPDTHRHTAPVTIGGVTLAMVVEIINGYTVTFENGMYGVNVIGGNSNLADVLNVNSVSIRTANSAGLVQVISGSGVTEADKDDIRDRILSDATRFAGANIDAAVSSRALPGDSDPLGRLDAAISSRALPGDSDPLGRLDAAISSRAAPSDLTNLDAAISSRATPSDLVNLDVAVSSRAAPGDLTTPRPKRGVALANFTLVMYDSTNRSPLAGLTVVGKIRKDTGAFVALTNAVAAVSNGVYTVDLTAAEMTADLVTLLFTATGAEPTIVTMVTAQ